MLRPSGGREESRGRMSCRAHSGPHQSSAVRMRDFHLGLAPPAPFSLLLLSPASSLLGCLPPASWCMLRKSKLISI